MKRRYHMGARAEQAANTRRRILDAALELFSTAAYDDVSLERIAARARVALKTVLRRFHSKDGLLLACRALMEERESRIRAVPPGDLSAVARVLARRYEETMDMVLGAVFVEPRVDAVSAVLARARTTHWRWLEQAFAAELPPRAHPAHRRRVAELFGATEIYVWHSWRRRLGLSRKVATEALEETLRALVDRWQEREHG
jgi:AcrR family transcriptional regulator